MPKRNKSFQKRFTLTKTGKLIRRTAGQNHFNAKESRRSQRRKGRSLTLSTAFIKAIKQRM